MKISTENKEVSSVEKLLTMKLWGGRDIRKDIFVKGPFCFRILKEKKIRNKKTLSMLAHLNNVTYVLERVKNVMQEIWSKLHKMYLQVIYINETAFFMTRQ